MRAPAVGGAALALPPPPPPTLAAPAPLAMLPAPTGIPEASPSPPSRSAEEGIRAAAAAAAAGYALSEEGTAPAMKSVGSIAVGRLLLWLGSAGVPVRVKGKGSFQIVVFTKLRCVVERNPAQNMENCMHKTQTIHF